MVASIGACLSPAYYLQAEEVSLYYLTGEVGVGQWYGEGAERLGYKGYIEAEQLIAAFQGLSPDGRTPLVQHHDKRQPAWDITFSAPKSVSVLWSVLDADGRHRIEGIVMRAAQRAIDYVDAEALFTRRGEGGLTVE